MKKLIFGLIGLMIAFNVWAEDRKFASPDGRIVVTVSVDEGMPVYDVTYDGQQFLLPSPLGLETNIGDYTCGLTLMPEQAAPRLIEESYTLKTIKQSKVDYKATEAVCSFAKDDAHVFDVIFRVSDRDVAFRYKM